MKRLSSCPRRGSTLVLTLVFVVMFSAVAVAMMGMSGTNVQIARNQCLSDNARGCAESGQDILRYWMGGVAFSGKIPPGHRLSTLVTVLQNNLAAAGITNILPVYNGVTMTISNVPLDWNQDRSFSAILTKITDERVRVDVTGHYRGVDRTLRSTYLFSTRAHNIFDYGLGSRGPMHLAGRIDIVAALEVEANAYIMSPSNTVALTMEGRSKIGGTVTLEDETCLVDLQGEQVWIGDLHGQEARQNVKYDSNSAIEFPEMEPNVFTPYATNVLTGPPTPGATLTNIRVPAGMDPNFTGGTTLLGVVYIETPNVVTFGGGTTITGVIVTNGDPMYDPDPNNPDALLTFGSNVNSFPVTDLPEEPQFAELREKPGTFILAPGFRVVFTGTFGILSGAIGCNGFRMSGGTGGVVNGSIINYADEEMYLSGNGDVYFNRSGLTEVPAGFVPQTVMRYDPSSYIEVPL